jgi:hypothetical protein
MMRGLRAGLIGGVAAVAAMYLAAPLTGVRSLPDLLQEPVPGLLPGPVFGFLIDTLQQWGKRSALTTRPASSWATTWPGSSSTFGLSPAQRS